MKMIRPLLLATALCVAVLPVAAQRVPVSQGATSSGLSAQIEQVRIQNAEARIQIGMMVEDVQRLTGKVETLEFLLSQSRDEFNNMQGDNQELSRQMSSLRGQLSQQDKKIKGLEARLAATARTSSSYGGASTVTRPAGTTSAPRATPPTRAAGPAQTTTSTGTTTGPRRLTTGSASNASTARTTTVTTGTGTAITTPRATAPTTPASGQPVQSGSLGTLPASQLPGGAGPLFADAKSKLLKFQYAQAEVAFRAFLDQFGGDPQAGEAQYWLGEVLYQQKAYAESGKAYTQMIRAYPKDPRAPDALVKLARSMRLVGDSAKACLALDTLPRQYPKASGVTRDLAAVERTRSGCDS